MGFFFCFHDWDQGYFSNYKFFCFVVSSFKEHVATSFNANSINGYDQYPPVSFGDFGVFFCL